MRGGVRMMRRKKEGTYIGALIHLPFSFFSYSFVLPSCSTLVFCLLSPTHLLFSPISHTLPHSLSHSLSLTSRQLVAVDVSGVPRPAFARLSPLNMQTRSVACIPGEVCGEEEGCRGRVEGGGEGRGRREIGGGG